MRLFGNYAKYSPGQNKSVETNTIAAVQKLETPILFSFLSWSSLQWKKLNRGVIVEVRKAQFLLLIGHLHQWLGLVVCVR
jgi:hypothetical protein